MAAEHLATRPSNRSHTDFSGSGGGTPVARVNAFALGRARFEDFDVDVISPASGIDGLLGWPLYRDLLVTLDYPNHVLVLRRGDLPPPDRKDVLPLRLDNDRLTVPVNLNGQELWVTLDTGWANGGNIELTSALADSLKWVSPLRATTSGEAVLGAVTTKLGRLEGKMIVGRHTLLQPVAGTNSGNKFPILGAVSLYNFVLTLDLRNMRVKFERQSSEPIRTPSILVAGFSCDLTGDQLKVTEVLVGSDAEHASLRADDLILTIDGKPALEGLFAHAGGPYAIHLRRGDASLDLSVPMTCLVP